jgi:hypothetical protein
MTERELVRAAARRLAIIRHAQEVTAWRILKRLEMNRLPASQRYKRHVDRWKRYESRNRDTGCRSTLSSLRR